MKNIMIAGSALLLCTTAAIAQSESGTGRDEKEIKRESRKTERESKRNERTASYQSQDAFMHDFADALNVNWRVTDAFDEATFDLNGITMTAYYDADDELVGTTTEKTFNDIPMKAQEHIKKFYSDYKPVSVIMFDDNENNETDMVLYNSAFEDEDNYFVMLKNDKETVILKVSMDGDTSFFKNYNHS
ncbi:MAG: hypothetical protein WDO19_27285 [Bacteroidota bacterium]